MKAGDAEYLALVERKREEIRMHKVTQLTEQQVQDEIRAITEGSFDANGSPVEPSANLIPPKKRGRPKGSKNKPK